MNLLGAQKMRNLAKHLAKKIPKGWGFALLVFPFNRPGISNYISNARREDMILALKEKIKTLENREDFQTPEEN